MTNDLSNSIFISYRRSVTKYIALLLFKELHKRGYNVFWDIDSIGPGKFERIILGQIAVRTHFLILCANGAFDRCVEPGDWVRREIEHAMDHKRNIIPVFIDDFDINASQKYLTGKLERLFDYNATPLRYEFFDAGIDRLCNQYLIAPEPVIDAILPPGEQYFDVPRISGGLSVPAKPAFPEGDSFGSAGESPEVEESAKEAAEMADEAILEAEDDAAIVAEIIEKAVEEDTPTDNLLEAERLFIQGLRRQ